MGKESIIAKRILVAYLMVVASLDSDFMDEVVRKYKDIDKVRGFIDFFNRQPVKNKKALIWWQKNDVNAKLYTYQNELEDFFSRQKGSFDFQKYRTFENLLYEKDKETYAHKLTPEDFDHSLFPRHYKAGDIDVYVVDNSEDARIAVKKIANSQRGEKFKNWCVIDYDIDNPNEGKYAWNAYHQKKIAFKDGILVSFYGNGWYDINNECTGNNVYKDIVDPEIDEEERKKTQDALAEFREIEEGRGNDIKSSYMTKGSAEVLEAFLDMNGIDDKKPFIKLMISCNRNAQGKVMSRIYNEYGSDREVVAYIAKYSGSRNMLIDILDKWTAKNPDIPILVAINTHYSSDDVTKKLLSLNNEKVNESLENKKQGAYPSLDIIPGFGSMVLPIEYPSTEQC